MLNQIPSFWSFILCLIKSFSFQKFLITSLHVIYGLALPPIQNPGYVYRGGVENTRLEPKAKDTKNFRGQGQGHKKFSRPRTDPLEAKDQGHRRKCSPKKRSSKFFFRRSQKKSLQKFFQAKNFFKIFFQVISTWGNQKKGLCWFSARFLAFSNEISTVQR